MLPPISETIRDRKLRFAGHCYQAKTELVSDMIIWQPTHGRRSHSRPAKTYFDQLTEDNDCDPETLPVLLTDRDNWKESVAFGRVHLTQQDTVKVWYWTFGRIDV